jgi:glutamate-5-semialdehyde dehydrogenase
VTVEDICVQAREAAAQLAVLARVRKDEALESIVEALDRRRDEILRDNADDIVAARAARLADEVVDRLYMDEERLAEVGRDLLRLAALDDPVGVVDRGWRLANGLEVHEQRVPFGVIAIIHEWRPRVTVDAAAVALKAGNAVILRGAASGKHTNRILAEVVEGAIIEAGLPPRAVSHLSTESDELLELLRAPDGLDLVVPLGGADLRDYVRAHAAAPTLYSTGGNCHVYIDAAADPEKATRIVVDAKCQRASEGGSAETLLVHGTAARSCLPAILTELVHRGVELVGDRTAADIMPDLPMKRANRSHYEQEFLGAKIAVRVVASLDEAVAHIAEFGRGHSEAIVTEDADAARAFSARVDAACVYVNASTRFTDGEVFGFGLDLGACTQKLHERGPIGPRTLTCSKYVVWGDGHVRG